MISQYAHSCAPRSYDASRRLIDFDVDARWSIASTNSVGRRARARRSAAKLRASLGIIASLLAAQASHAALIPTEIYYNGPLGGADPDEFLEISNRSVLAVDLGGYRFGAGLSLSFESLLLRPKSSLVVAPNPDGFRKRFPDFSGLLVDTAGGLSNGGETLELLDATGASVFSVRYDDTGLWPRGADGGGESLQLLADAVDLNAPASWTGASPTPGRWDGFGTVLVDNEPTGAASVPTPTPAHLFLVGLIALYRAVRDKATKALSAASR
ncbi:MAG: lamin tail domain-containing protein [Halieaceae bacterium]|jgi:hypothetical protein|nr:lamin tail domain-containing protein [Halieaceae bacterium]